MPLPASPAAWLPATVSPGRSWSPASRKHPRKVPWQPVLLVVISPGHLGTHTEMLLPGNAATSCPEVPSPGRFPVPVPTSSCCCSEPLQRSRFTSYKSVWRGNGSGSSVVPGEGRQWRLSLLQTLSHRYWSPCADRTWPPAPAWLDRCPKWIKEPWKPAGSDSPAAVGCHRGQADGAQTRDQLAGT